MNTDTFSKNCIACNKPVKGRTDKKFCNEYCRNNFNNRLKAENNNLVRNINNALGKNRRILESMFHKDETAVRTTAGKLLLSGFHFKYFTHVYTSKEGDTYFFCYDHGYLPLENDRYVLVKSKKEV
jgi:YHS domain-containing protein